MASVLDDDRARTLRGNQLADGYVRPDYDGYCFSNVPGTAAQSLGVDVGRTLPDSATDGVETDADRVLVLFLDALGYEQFGREYASVPFLHSFVEAGRVTPLTSTYPSETAACVTTMHTAQPPVSHGLLGWNAYDPAADAVYETLPCAAKDGEGFSVSAEDLFDGEPMYEDLAAAGVDCRTVEPDGTGYDEVSTKGATNHHYARTTEFALAVRDAVRDSAAPSYTYAYYPEVDSVAHHEGPDSELYGLQVAAVCDALERAFATLDDEVAEETLVCLVADHGQVPVETPTVLDETDVLEYVKTDRSGHHLVLGGPRNVHLHLENPERDAEYARNCFTDVETLVLSKEEALEADLWGPGDPGPAFERNCGDLIVVPRSDAIWHSNEPEELELQGMHGGLAAGEALVPFGVARLSALQ